VEEIMAAYCDGIRVRANREAEAVFPGVSHRSGHMVFLAQNEIDAAMAGQDFKMIAPIVYGCLNYKSPHVEGIRQTRFAYHLSSANENGAVVIMPNEPDWLQKPILLTSPGTIVAD
jgi:hypothetical protein